MGYEWVRGVLVCCPFGARLGFGRNEGTLGGRWGHSEGTVKAQ